MQSNRQAGIINLLKGIETGDPASVEVINPDQYIQHNPQTYEGRDGLARLFKQLSQTNPRVNIVRIFEDGDYVFAHTEYDFAQRNIGFEVFRFEGDQTVEHWDNIQRRKGPNESGHSMVDGPTEVVDIDQTENNRKLIQEYVDSVLIGGNHSAIENYLNEQQFIQHSPEQSDGIASVVDSLISQSGQCFRIQYQKCHRILAEGNFVLTVCEGVCNDKHSAIYELYRIDNGKIVEHWDTKEAVPPKEEWKNDNGKF